MEDTMMVFNDQQLSKTFLSKDDLRKICPLAFMQTPSNPHVSDKYVMANSETVIDDMAKLGWFPVEAKQRKGRKTSSGIYSFHMIVFQNPDYYITKPDDNGGNVVDCYPRIIMTNSHDGFNSFKFMCGLFRLVCSNGLVIMDEEMVNMSIRHINYTFEELRKLINHTINELPNKLRVMNDMQTVYFDEEKKRAFVSDMLKIRKGIKDNDDIELSNLTIQDILTPNRDEDTGDDLWTVFNVVQEKMIKGGFHMQTQKSMRRARPIKSFVKDLDMNAKMFDCAKKYLDVLKMTNKHHMVHNMRTVDLM